MTDVDPRLEHGAQRNPPVAGPTPGEVVSEPQRERARRVPGPTGNGRLRLTLLAAAVVALCVWSGRSMAVMILSLIVIITLHELGHYLTARAAGMKVTEFFMGFGPRLWSVQRGETEYGVKLIPAGAYVKIAGMHNLDDVDPADEARTYRQKSYLRRLSVAVAGSAMHFAIALVLLFTVLVGWGAPGARLFSSDQEQNWQVGLVEPASAAATAGLQVGDRIVAFDAGSVETFEDLAAFVAVNPGREVSVTVDRGGELSTLPLTIGTRPTGDVNQPERGFLGIGRGYRIERLGPIEAVPAAFADFGTLTWETVKGMGRIFSPSGLSSYARQVFTPSSTDDGVAQGPVGEEPAEDGRLVSIYGASRIGAGLLDAGVDRFLVFLVLLNVFIGLFNLVPLLPLDGGHVAIATYERLREIGRGGRRYFVDVAKLLPVTYAVVTVLVFIGLSSLYLDIAQPLPTP